MDALDNGTKPLDPDYWCAYLAAAIGCALVTEPFDHSRKALEHSLREFTKARACTASLREDIRRIRKGETL